MRRPHQVGGQVHGLAPVLAVHSDGARNLYLPLHIALVLVRPAHNTCNLEDLNEFKFVKMEDFI